MAKTSETKKEYQDFAKKFQKIWSQKKKSRDDAVGILSRDLLANREKLTENGRQNLILQYGKSGDKVVQYTLSDLNKMAEAMDKQEAKFQGHVKGISVSQVLVNSRVKVPFSGSSKPPKLTDYAKARDQIKTSALFKIDGNTLHFRVLSSEGDKYYLARVRLNSWDSEIRQNSNYNLAATNATMGLVSFDCSCGRHQYWFRYLATIGGFALDPYEEAFPKIRNPKLVGVCCKHMVKTLAVLQTASVRARLAIEMAKQAKAKGWTTEIDKRKPAVLNDADLKKMEEASDIDIGKVFQEYELAKQALKRKMQESPETMEKIKALEAHVDAQKTLRKKAESKANALKETVIRKDLDAFMAKAVYRDKKTKDEAIELYSKQSNISLKELHSLGSEILKEY